MAVLWMRAGPGEHSDCLTLIVSSLLCFLDGKDLLNFLIPTFNL